MRQLALTIALALLAPALAPGQVPASGPSIRKEKAAGAEAEFVNYPWRPDVFQTMESGGTVAEGQRSWAFARLSTSSFFAVDGAVIPPGHYVLVLNPKAGNLPMTLELRRGNTRAMFADVNAMSPPPPGETVYKSAAAFVTSADPVPSLDITLTGWPDGVTLRVRYGNRKLTKDLGRVVP